MSPPDRRAPARLALRATTPTGSTGPSVEYWHREEGRWIATSGEVPVSEALGPGGRVRVRLGRDESGPVPSFDAVHLIYEAGPAGP